MSNNNQMINMLTVVLVFMIGILFVLCAAFIVLKLKNREPKEIKKKEQPKKGVAPKGKTIVAQNYTKDSIYKFMEFDKIDDNMIVQKDGKRYLMVIECQGINFDLMSGLEKNSVEQGFVQFLNTLRYPIQIYVQTRTVNLGGSIDTYNKKVEEISKQYATKQAQVNQMARSGQYSEQQMDKVKYELARQRNLYEYGIDIVKNTERMSLNKNILSKHYYVILSAYPEEAIGGNYAKEEIANLAFSDLYTRAQSVINALSVCGINSKIMDSTELAELLYVAYNRDESEVYNLKRTLDAGYEDLYSTAPDVLDKRMKELDIKVEQEAIERANEILYGVIEENEKQKRVKEQEDNLDMLIDQMASTLIKENEQQFGKEIADQAVEILENRTKEKGGESNDEKAKTTRRKSTKSI